MVGRHHQHYAVAEFRQRAQRSQRDGGGGVAAGRFEQRAAAGEIEAGEIGMNTLGVALGGDQEDRRLAIWPCGQPAQGLGQHRAIAGKVVDCFGLSSRDSGQSRDPTPPLMTKLTIRSLIQVSRSRLWPTAYYTCV
ncbi:hypothetical protein AJ88_08660 [Mesorhizobium amorphae CCBAU 01583]|nr:hypothetical protein AJ88_08660 [Mesorhizobium amorphae CCBAU 01583]